MTKLNEISKKNKYKKKTNLEYNIKNNILKNKIKK